jgi:hypothetical protein
LCPRCASIFDPIKLSAPAQDVDFDSPRMRRTAEATDAITLAVEAMRRRAD